MPSAIWTGSISFGLVQVPVRLVGATKNKDVSFNQLEEGTGARIRYKKVSDQTGEEVPADRIKRGYEISKGRYVTIEPDELEALRPKGSHAIEIEEFADLDEIDPLYFEQPYYLVPDARGVKPYELLPEEDVDLTDRERAMARQLVESLAVDHFDPEKFHDQYREQVLDLIERKAAGEEIVAEPVVEAPAKVLDLVAALEASLEKASTAKERHPSVAAAARGTKPAAAKKAVKQPAKKRAAKTEKTAAKKRSA